MAQEIQKEGTSKKKRRLNSQDLALDQEEDPVEAFWRAREAGEIPSSVPGPGGAEDGGGGNLVLDRDGNVVGRKKQVWPWPTQVLCWPGSDW